jgi:hypothetical protein
LISAATVPGAAQALGSGCKCSLGVDRDPHIIPRRIEPPPLDPAWLLRRALEANQQQRARTARQLGITRKGLYKKRPTLTGIARVLRHRGLAGLAP